MNEVPLFMTHHAPLGAWASLTFGLPGLGVSIDLESPGVEATADLIVAASRGRGNTHYLPFASALEDGDRELVESTDWKSRWQRIADDEVKRSLSPGIDQYTARDLELKVFTPHERLPDPETGVSLASAVCPGVLIEVTLDNRHSSVPATGFLGLDHHGRGRIAALDDASRPGLCGVRFSQSWALAALTSGNVFTIRDNSIAAHVELSTPVVHNGGQQGGIAFRVAPGQAGTLTAVFGFYKGGIVTQGLASRYLYTRSFEDVESVCRHQLRRAEAIRSSCREFDAEILGRGLQREPYQVLCQALRAYAANTQVLQLDDRVVFNVSEGRYLWRNTLDLAADHLPWELGRNPWVVRNIVEQYLARYSYRDQVRFADEPGRSWPGGLSFTHDMGNYTTFSPAGESGYEVADSPHYGFMTTEQLLNGIYCLCGYVLATGDLTWAGRHATPLADLLESLENRDHHDREQRDGLLAGESLKCGPLGREITTYDCLDPALVEAGGNLYLAVKTWCSLLLLEEVFGKLGLAVEAERAAKMATRTLNSLQRFWDPEGCFLRSSLEGHRQSLISAAYEPLALPLFLGLETALSKDTAWLKRLEAHARSCLQPGRCLDATTGGLRLSSRSHNTWPSKSLLCFFVWERFLGLNLREDYPSLWRELLAWTQVSAARTTIADQINSEDRTVIGALWYPRSVTAAVWIPLKEKEHHATNHLATAADS